MFSKRQLERYAATLYWGLTTSRAQPFKRHDPVLILCDPSGTPLMEAVYAKLLAAGLNPVPRVSMTHRMELSFYTLADDKQLVFQSAGMRELYKKLCGAVYILSPDSLTHLAGIEPGRIARVAVARKPLRDILTKREQEGVFGWTLCMYPTAGLARLAGCSRKEYAARVAKACKLDAANPEKAWMEVFTASEEIKKWLNAMDAVSYHVESASTDLSVSLGESRRFLGVSGHNIPSFEIFTSPDWRGVSGVFFADQPSYRSGNYVRGARLVFRDGQVVESSAMEGEEFLRKQVAMDSGSGKVGEFSLTDKRFSSIDAFMANTLFDENFGGEHGNCHIAIGASYAETFSGDQSTLTKERKAELGFNDSALHWDLVNTEKKRVRAKLRGGEQITIYEDGVFLY